MDFYNALTVDGVDAGRVLCYGLFPFDGAMDSYQKALNVAEKLGCEVYRFAFDEAGVELILLEVDLNESVISEFIISAFDGLFSVGPCLGAFCLFDGAFFDYSDIFSIDIPPQMYAFSCVRGGPVMNFDIALLNSPAWSDAIREFQAGLARKVEGVNFK